jgi:hypothetical protein
MKPELRSVFLPIVFALVSLGFMLPLAQVNNASPVHLNDGRMQERLPETSTAQRQLSEQASALITPFSTTLTYTLYLPLVLQPPGRLYGQVLENGVPAVGVPVTLYFCRDYEQTFAVVCFDTQVFNTVTDEAGRYEFTDMPTLIVTGSLMLPQTYQMVWNRFGSDPNRLLRWQSRKLSSYTAGDVVDIGDFDISGIQLIAPRAGSVVTFPVTFQWTVRSEVPSDSYSPCIWWGGSWPKKPLPPPMEVVRCHEPLGYVDSFVLERPAGFYLTDCYWIVEVYDPTGGVGVTDLIAFKFQ